MRIAILLAFATALLADRASCATLTGSVLDPSGRPIPRADVSLFPRDQIDPMRLLTSDAGTFRFEKLVPGEYVLQVQAPGFARYKSEIVSVEPSATLNLDVSLALASQQQEVVVTASGTPQSIDEVSKSINVLDRESIEQRDEFFIPQRCAPPREFAFSSLADQVHSPRSRSVDCATKTRGSWWMVSVSAIPQLLKAKHPD
jgi:Carboxypeptidase regulatory-like domain